MKNPLQGSVQPFRLHLTRRGAYLPESHAHGDGMPRPATHHVPLNLRMSPEVVRLGKRMARKRGTTVSALVSECLLAMARLEEEPTELHPVLEQLAGFLPDPGIPTRDLVMAELERKYGSSP